MRVGDKAVLEEVQSRYTASRLWLFSPYSGTIYRLLSLQPGEGKVSGMIRNQVFELLMKTAKGYEWLAVGNP